jgi:hypothetical protein
VPVRPQGDRVEVIVLGRSTKMVFHVSFRRKPEPRDPSFSATFALFGEWRTWIPAFAGMTKASRRNDEGEQTE